MGLISGALQGLSNIASGGSWSQSGSEIAAQEFSAQQAALERQFNAQQAQIARDFNAKEAETARAFSALEAQKQRDYEERLSNTAYSRAVQDLKSVGINPYAIGSFGSASTPSGSTAQAVSASSGSASSGGGARSSGHPADNGAALLSVLGSALKVVGAMVAK